jgi:hypothetical protein
MERTYKKEEEEDCLYASTILDCDGHVERSGQIFATAETTSLGR